MTRESAARRWAVVAVFGLAYLLSFFYRSTNAVIAEDLTRDVGLDAGALGFMTSAFLLSFAAVQLPLGAALDRFGARYVTATLLLAAVAGSLLFSLGDSFEVLVIGRALIGLGMAGVLMGALKAFASWFSPRAFAAVSSVFVGLGSMGALLAATPLVYLSGTIGWRAVFAYGALLVLLAAAAIALVAREPGSRVATTRGASTGFADVFGDRDFWRLALLTLAVTGGLFAWQGLWAGPLLMQRLGLDSVTAGNVLLALGLGVTAGFLGSGIVAGRIGVTRTVAFGATGFGLALVAWLLATPAWPLPLLHGMAAATGMTAASNVLSYAVARDAFPHMPGRAVTAVNLFAIGGGALLQWGLGALMGAFPTSAGAQPFGAALVASAALVALALVGYLPLLQRAPPKRASAESS